VPGMLSVLNADQLRRRGFRTVWEALASLPGVKRSTPRPAPPPAACSIPR
jgi:outer membrane receptor for ferrienterochelin and colicin